LTEDDFVRIKMLGKGNGGEVLAVKHKATGTSMARKLIRLQCACSLLLLVLMRIFAKMVCSEVDSPLKRRH